MLPGRLCLSAVALFVAACGSSTSSTTAAPKDAGTDSTDSGSDAGLHARLFVTSQSYAGDLRDAAQTPTGLAAGDKLCQEAAAAAGLSGTFKAWLSDATTDAIDRVGNVPDGWYSVGPKAAKIADNKASLVAKGPSALIVDEHGKPVTGCPWTGTHPDGMKATSGLNVGSDGTCTGWTASGVDFAVAGGIGPTTSPFNLIAGCPAGGGTAYSQCQNPQPIYCFQQ